MSTTCHETKDLADFPKFGGYAPAQGKVFFDYYAASTSAGALTEREKTLIALAVAATRHCAYCIDASTNKCLSVKKELYDA
jgi:alkylhydroperoxidase/carboxymuconolactone decarboxylase family protein YurZ